MNRDQVAGNWTQLRGKIREKWDELTDNLDQMPAGGTDSWGSSRSVSATIATGRDARPTSSRAW